MKMKTNDGCERNMRNELSCISSLCKHFSCIDLLLCVLPQWCFIYLFYSHKTKRCAKACETHYKLGILFAIIARLRSSFCLFIRAISTEPKTGAEKRNEEMQKIWYWTCTGVNDNMLKQERSNMDQYCCYYIFTTSPDVVFVMQSRTAGLHARTVVLCWEVPSKTSEPALQAVCVQPLDRRAAPLLIGAIHCLTAAGVGRLRGDHSKLWTFSFLDSSRCS